MSGYEIVMDSPEQIVSAKLVADVVITRGKTTSEQIHGLSSTVNRIKPLQNCVTGIALNEIVPVFPPSIEMTVDCVETTVSAASKKLHHYSHHE